MKRNPIQTALSLILVGLYAAGLIVMIFGNFQAGLMLWVISTLGGIALLYWLRELKRRAEDAEKIASGMPYGEPDDPARPLEPVVPKEKDA